MAAWEESRSITRQRFSTRNEKRSPFITVFVFSIISGALTKYFDKKTIIIVGLILYGAAGITPAFAQDVTTILILRFMTGVGVGLIFFCGGISDRVGHKKVIVPAATSFSLTSWLGSNVM